MIALRPGVVIAGRYVLDTPLASGGMGSVWTAHDRALDVVVAVKFMSESLAVSPEARARFEREARATARLRSQHVVQVLDYGVEGSTPYLAMELLHGESLATRLQRRYRISIRAAAPIVVQVARALGTAHQAGLVHRDVKPANVFLALKDEEEVVKVLDFGIAKTSTAAVQCLTAPRMLLGTVPYMSPEQILSSKTVDHRSDLWSLGVVIYRMLTGRVPFSGGGFAVAGMGGEHGAGLPSVGPDLPAQLDDFFARALAWHVDRRFQSARELLEAFCAVAMLDPPPSSHPGAPPWSSTIRMMRPALRCATLAADADGGDGPTRVMPGRTPLPVTSPQAARGPRTEEGADDVRRGLPLHPAVPWWLAVAAIALAWLLYGLLTASASTSSPRGDAGGATSTIS